MPRLEDAILNSLHHHCAEGQLTKCERVTKVVIGSNDKDACKVVDNVPDYVVNFVSEQGLLANCQLFFVDVIDHLGELLLPSKELDSLDVVEGLADVKRALCFLVCLLLSYVLLGLTAKIVAKHTGHGNSYDYQAVPADLLEQNNRSRNQVQGALYEAWRCPDEVPNPVWFSHDDVAYLT